MPFPPIARTLWQGGIPLCRLVCDATGFGKGKIEGRSFVYHTLRPGFAAMSGDNTTDNGQANARALEIVGGMQPLKNTKELVRVARVEPDSVIPDKEYGFVPRLFATDLDLRFSPFAGILHRIAKQIYNHLPQRHRVGVHYGKCPDRPFDFSTANLGRQILNDPLDEVLGFDSDELQLRSS